MTATHPDCFELWFIGRVHQYCLSIRHPQRIDMTKRPDIDSSELGQLPVPPPPQSYKKKMRMLIDELAEAWSELRKWKHTIMKLVAMYDKLVKPLAVLKIERYKIRGALSDTLLAEGPKAGRKLTPGRNVQGGYGSPKNT